VAEPKYTALDDELHRYLVEHGARQDGVLRRVQAETEAMGDVAVMQVAPDQGAFITLLCRLIEAREAIELGTFTGYSAICIARGLAPGGRLVACELSEEYAEAAARNIEAAGVADRVEIRIGPAADTVAAIPEREVFDFAFIDADKPGYPHYYELLLARLRPGGLVMVDNVLAGGAVGGSARRYRRGVGPGNRAVGGLIAIMIIIIVVVSGAALLGSGDTTERISDGVSDTFSGLVGGGTNDGRPDVEVPETPAEPQGDQTWVLTEEELNQRIARNPDAFSPAEDVSIELGEGTVTVHFRAYGVNGTYHGTLTTSDGVPVVADSTIDGALGWVVSSSQIDDVLNQEMASAVAEQQVSVESVHVRPGQMIFGISS
jgi:caffeoyl-CoA O-methyltransferase